MSINGIKREERPWDFNKDNNLKQHTPVQIEQTIYASTLTSLKSEDASLNTTAISTISSPEKGNGILTWFENLWKALQEYVGKKNEVVSTIDKIENPVKKPKAVSIESVARKTALKSTQKQPLQSVKAEKDGFFDKIGEWFEDKINWIKEKWDSFLEELGIKARPLKTKERDRTKKTDILKRRSPFEIDEEFKYIDLSAVDPLKAMLIVLVQQGHIREEQAFLIQQKILLMQEDLKDIHEQKTVVQAELALIGKRSGVLEKVNVAVTVGQVIAGLVSTATVVAGAATIVTVGAASPALAVLEGINAVLSAVVYGAKAANTWLTADTNEKMDKLKADMIERHETKEAIQFQMKLGVNEMKIAVESLGDYAENGAMVLQAQQGK